MGIRCTPRVASRFPLRPRLAPDPAWSRNGWMKSPQDPGAMRSRKKIKPPMPARGGPFRFLVRYFFRGLLFVVPLAATIWILQYAFNWIDGLVTFDTDQTWTIPLLRLEVTGESLAWRGFGFLVIVGAVIGIGLLTSNVLTQWILRRIEDVFAHVPVVKQIYSAIKDMVQAFVSEEKKFDKPVLLSLSATPEVEVIGFVTRSGLAERGRPGKVAVYGPQSYNFAANLILVPKERVTPIDLPASDVMTFVVSGGVSESTVRKGEKGKKAGK